MTAKQHFTNWFKQTYPHPADMLFNLFHAAQGSLPKPPKVVTMASIAASLHAGGNYYLVEADEVWNSNTINPRLMEWLNTMSYHELLQLTRIPAKVRKLKTKLTEKKYLC